MAEADYRVVPGSFEVIPTKPSFTQDEDVKLQIKCLVQRRNGVSAMLAWTSVYEVYDNKGNLLAEDSHEHAMAPWTDIDTGDDDFIINLGRFTPGALLGDVRVSAHG